MKNYPVSLLLIAASLLLSACGFHLRGEESVGLPADSIHLDTSGGGQTGREVREQLKLTDIRLTESAKQAEYIVRVTNEDFEREVLTVSPRTGKVEEYELILNVYLTIATADGKTLINSERLGASRDYVYDQNAVIATGDEQQLIREELTRLIASQILLRSRAVIRNHQAGEEIVPADG